MNKYIIYITLTALLLSSCLIEDNAGGSGRSSTSSRGNNGVEISFMQGVPPSLVYVETGSNPDANFEVVININNKGFFPRNELGSLNGRIHLSGFDSNVIRNGRWDGGNQFNRIQASSEYFPEGGSEQKRFVAPEINYPFDAREYPLDLLATACYYYETEATGIVCIDPNPASQVDKVCRMGRVSVDPQGAPVIVTGVEQTGNSRNIFLSLEVANVGSGTVLKEFDGAGVITEDRCLSTSFGDTDLIGIDASIVGIGDGDCRPQGTHDDPVRLYEGRGPVVCTFELPENIDPAYTAQMKITLQYGYRQTARKQVTLVNTAAR